MNEKSDRPTVTLQDGAVVDARAAASILERLRVAQVVYPDEFRSLLALAQNRVADADPHHFHELRVQFFLADERGNIRPDVRAVLLSSYDETPEGPILAPLKLRGSGDKESAAWVEQELERFYCDLLRGVKGKGRSIE